MCATQGRRLLLKRLQLLFITFLFLLMTYSLLVVESIQSPFGEQPDVATPVDGNGIQKAMVKVTTQEG